MEERVFTAEDAESAEELLWQALDLGEDGKLLTYVAPFHLKDVNNARLPA